MGEDMCKLFKSKTLINKVYDDAIHPVAKETGEVTSLIPRAIRRALLPLEKWIIDGEYSLKEAQQLLELRLKSIPVQEIVPPEAYVAVPAIQALSYSINSSNLRNMYANLLAKAMTKSQKDKVHPSFVEIIKQMSPLDAQNLACLNQEEIPVARYLLCEDKKDKNETHEKQDILPVLDSSQGADNVFFNRLSNTCVYFVLLTDVCLLNPNEQNLRFQSLSLSSLQRLGLINIEYGPAVAEYSYEQFKETNEYYDFCESSSYRGSIKIDPGVALITPLGKVFFEVCVAPENLSACIDSPLCKSS